jgi:hypothetical protein
MTKNVTLSADEHLIAAARRRAAAENRTLNDLFREWLARYAGEGSDAEVYRKLMEHLSRKVVAGRKFSRDEMNER